MIQFDINCFIIRFQLQMALQKQQKTVADLEGVGVRTPPLESFFSLQLQLNRPPHPPTPIHNPPPLECQTLPLKDLA